MPAAPFQYFSTFANKKINDSISPQNYARSALLYLLMGVTQSQGADGLGIGRPGEGMYLTGAAINQAEKDSVRGVDIFLQRFQSAKAHNTAVTGPFGTMPSVANATTASQDILGMNAAAWRWCVNIDTPIVMWNTTREMAQAKASQDNGVALGIITEEVTQQGIEEHYDQINSRLIYGAPSNQDAITWDDISGVISALTPTSRYAMVDRSLIATNHPFYPQYVSTYSADISRIVDYANTKLGLNVFGPGSNCILCGADNFNIFKNQAIARDKSGVNIQGKDAAENGLPGLAASGITREVVRVGNTFIMQEPFLDTCYGLGTNGTALYTAQPGYVLVLNLRNWKFITHPNRNMKVDNMTDLHNTGVANPDYTQGFVRTWASLQCLRPQVNALFAAVT